MKRLFIALMLFPLAATATTITQSLCHRPGYHCIKVLAGDSWESLWPKKKQALAVQRVNRMNIPLKPGTTLAVPDKLDNITSQSFSPLPLRIYRQARRTVWVALSLQAWGAYDFDGELVYWGPLSSGANICKETNKKCRSSTGNYNVRMLSGPNCISKLNPKGECGGEGQGSCIYYSTSKVRQSQPIHSTNHAILASRDLPGFASTTGCLHILPEDFDWLFNEFIYIPWNSTDIGTAIKIRN